MISKVLKIFIPTLISYSTFMLVSIVDAMFIGNFFGSDAQAAIGLITPLLLFITCIIFSINIGANTYLAHAIGSEDDERVKIIYNHTVIYGSLLIILIVAVVNASLEPFLRVFSNNEQIINYGLQYGRLIIFNMIIMNLNIVLGFFQRTIGNGHHIASQALISLVVNVILNTSFIIIFNMGISGIALASIISNTAQLIYIIRAQRKENDPRLKLALVKFEPKLAISIIINGLSDALFDISLAAMTIVNNIILVHFLGDIGLTYMYILSQLNMIQLTVLFALADSTNPLIATSFGQGDLAKTKKLRSLAIKIAIICATIVYSLVFIFKPLLFRVYGVDANIYEQLKVISSIYMSVVFVFAINQVFTAFYTAIGQSTISLVMGLARNLVLPLICTVVIASFAGEKGVWFGAICGELIALFVIQYYTHKYFDKRYLI